MKADRGIRENGCGKRQNTIKGDDLCRRRKESAPEGGRKEDNRETSQSWYLEPASTSNGNLNPP